MKNLTELLQEFLVNNKVNQSSSELPKIETKSILAPIIASDGSGATGQVLEIDFGKKTKRFIVYKDLYYNESAHIADLSDFALRAGVYADTFEDFTPKDILFTSDSLKSCVLYVLTAQLNFDITDFIDGETETIYDEETLLDAIYNNNEDIVDNAKFLVDVLVGRISDEDECLDAGLTAADLNDEKKMINLGKQYY